MKKLALALGAAFVSMLTQPAAALNSQAFVDKAAIGGMFEVQSSELAKDKATTSQLKNFAGRMVTDHTKINDELKSLVNSPQVRGITLPQALDAAHQQKIDELRSASGAEFDQRYYDMQLSAHHDAVQLFQDEVNTGVDRQLQDWASAILPTLKDHLSAIKAIERPSAHMAANSNMAAGVTQSANAQDAKNLVQEAVNVVQQMKQDSEIAKLLERAKGVYIVPDFGRAALGIGARGGSGIMLVHKDGKWGNPGFYDFGAVSVGAQAGVSGGSIAYLLMSDRAVNSFMQTNNFSLNANAGLSIINYSANAQGSAGKGDVIVWSDTKGLFAGVSIGISDIVWNADESRAYYGGNPTTPQQVLNDRNVQLSEAQQLKKSLE